MTTNTAKPESDDSVKSQSADLPQENTVCTSAISDAPLITPLDALEADGLKELDDLLSKLDNPELVSIRHLFNMC